MHTKKSLPYHTAKELCDIVIKHYGKNYIIGLGDLLILYDQSRLKLYLWSPEIRLGDFTTATFKYHEKLMGVFSYYFDDIRAALYYDIFKNI